MATKVKDPDITDQSVVFLTRHVKKLIKRQEMFIRMAESAKEKHFKNTDADKLAIASIESGIAEDREILQLLEELLSAE